MKKALTIPLLVLMGAFTVGSAGSTPPTQPTAKECSDCGCSGPGAKGMCPDEKGKTCHCSKK